MFTGNRGCLLGDDRRLRRHHNGSLWIICRTSYRDRRHPLDAPRTWTPLFFLDDAVALAAGHRPCGRCRHQEYLSYRRAVTTAVGADRPVLADELNRRLGAERLRRGRGIHRTADRILTTGRIERVPNGAVIIEPDTGRPHLVISSALRPFSFDGWGPPMERPQGAVVEIITPPTSLLALGHGFEPVLHPSVDRTG